MKDWSKALFSLAGEIKKTKNAVYKWHFFEQFDKA